MNRLFEIQTLSEKRCFKDYGNLKNGGTVDPVTIITGGIGLLTQLFPGIFGNSQPLLTDQEWLEIIPGNGYITSSLRTWLKSHLGRKSDLTRIFSSGKPGLEHHTIGFAQSKSMLWCPDGSCQGNPESVLMPKFYAALKKESYTGGNLPIGTVPNFISGFGGLNVSTILLIGGGVFLLYALTNKKKSRSRK